MADEIDSERPDPQRPVPAEAADPQAPNFGRLLLIGTTGMLHAASLFALERAEQGVLLSRQAADYASGSPTLDARLHREPCDWADEAAFQALLARVEPIDTALVWLRPKALVLRRAISRCLAPDGLLVEVMGSRSVELGGVADQRAMLMHSLPEVTYAQLILGFREDRKGNRRWLTHKEISDGAIAQLRAPRDRLVIGQLDTTDPVLRLRRY